MTQTAERLGRHLLKTSYLRCYERVRPGTLAQVKAWLPVVAAARLREGISEEQEKILVIVAEGLGSEDCGVVVDELEEQVQ